MKERNENLQTDHFHNPFLSFRCDDDVIFLSTKVWMRRKNDRMLEFVLAATF